MVMEGTWIQQYLDRLEVRAIGGPSLSVLRQLHRRHLYAVPFENLLIRRGGCPTLEPESLFRKLIAGRQGGICYELNGLFGRFLTELGFDVELLGARVEEEGTPFDHLVLKVNIGENAYLADVGYGDHFEEPIPLLANQRFMDDRGVFWFEEKGQGLILWRERPPESKAFCYELHLTPRLLSDFEGRCDDYATSPDSRFKKGTIISRFTRDGRVSLTDDRLLVTAKNEKRSYPLEDARSFDEALSRFFPDLAGSWVDRGV